MRKERRDSSEVGREERSPDAPGISGSAIDQLAAQLGLLPAALARKLHERLQARAEREAEERTPSHIAERRQSLGQELLGLCAQALRDARAGRESEAWFLAEGRGAAGLLSDFLHDVVPPHLGSWSWVIRQLERAQERLGAGDLRAGHHALVLGLEWLAQTRSEWKRYLGESIQGAEDTVRWLGRVRDGALVAEVGLVTGGAAYGLSGGGALGTAGATLLGTGASTMTAAGLDTPLGAEVRGTLRELVASGAGEALRLGCHGLGGMVYGMGEALSGIGRGLVGLFADPRRFAEDVAELPARVGELWAARQLLFAALGRLEPREQAFQVGRLVGHLEALLALAEAGGAMGRTLGEGGGLGLGGAEVGAEGGAAVLALRGQLLALKGEAEALVVASGATVAAPGLYAMGLKDVRALLGEGPHTDAMQEVGAREAGVVERPVRHHVFPQAERKWFEERGFVGERDIDQFCIELDEAEHQALHGGGDWRLGRAWEGEWNRRLMADLKTAELDKGRKLTFEEIMARVRVKMKDVLIDKPFVNYR